MKKVNYDITHYLVQLKRWGRIEKMHPNPQGQVMPDLVVKLITDAGPMVYFVEIKPHLANMDIHWVIQQLQEYAKRTKEHWLLGAPYIRPQQTIVLMKRGIDYFDLAGNINLHRKGLNIHVEGKRPIMRPQQRTGRAFRPAGLQVVFTLLTQREAIYFPHRKLAATAGVAHGGIGMVIRDLAEKGYIVGAGRNARLAKKKELIAMWIDGYRAYLRPRLLLVRLMPKKRPIDELLKDIRGYFTKHALEWTLTGTEAAYRLMRYYRDETVTIFAKDIPADFNTALHCMPDQNGTLTVLNYFGDAVTNKFTKNDIPLAHPLLIYAELMYLGTDRVIETAQEFRKRFLEDLDSED